MASQIQNNIVGKYTDNSRLWLELITEAFVNTKFSTKKINNVILSGGKSPIDFYQKMLNNLPFNYENFRWWLGDERVVSINSSKRNEKMILDCLEPHIKQKFNLMSLNNVNEDDILVYEKNIHQYVPNLIFDLAILGLGTDGHFASIMPDSEFIKYPDKLLGIVPAINDEEFARFTLGFPIWNKAKKIIFIIKGKEKLEVFEKFLNKQEKYPACYIKNDNIYAFLLI